MDPLWRTLQARTSFPSTVGAAKHATRSTCGRHCPIWLSNSPMVSRGLASALPSDGV